MKKLLTTALFTSGLLAAPAMANLSVNVGAINVNPDSGTSYLNEIPTAGVSVDSNTQLGITFDYAINDNWVIELVAATPFSHDISGEGTIGDLAIGGTNIGSTKHLPPSLFAQYHFGSAGDKFRAFVGAGVNYTIFFDSEAGADLKAVLGTDDVELKLSNSFGLAGQVGANYMINEKWGVHVMASYIDIDTEAEVFANGQKALTSDVAIDPFVFMLGAKYKF
ncbi:OmpW family protein [Pseudoalteromonas sp.]|uniref:OmpW/AlkL family protein n=1 Tax=Pseudoalteromonas sp. TaxID=53249 RepID=UPI003561FF15